MANDREKAMPAEVGPRTSLNRKAAGVEPDTAKLFMNGRSQAVRLPKEFRLPGTEVRISRMGSGVLLQPIQFDVDAWFARLDAYGDEPFLTEGIDDPPLVEPENIFDE